MDLPLTLPIQPMLAKAVTSIPTDGDFSFEPKWDGFRCIVFKDGDEVELASRGSKPLTRYFPELVEAARAQLPDKCALDGEVVVRAGEKGSARLDFEALGQRIHPAQSRIAKLSVETPAEIIFFDALAVDDVSLLERPFSERRHALEHAMQSVGAPFHLTRGTDDPQLAQEWFERFEGAGLDGVVAKGKLSSYQPGKRTMLKIKHTRTADAVLLGYRIHKSGNGIGSLLLGLYRPDGELVMVGGAASFSDADRLAVLDELAPLSVGELRDGEPSRWNAAADKQWVPIRPERVAEVAYDQMEGLRFRHTVKFLRWRHDRDPGSCTFEQLDVPLSYDLADVLET